VRPGFDRYFMRIAELASTRSNCMKKANGAVIVQDKTIISTGYNGMPFGLRNCNQGGCERCNSNAAQGKDLDRCLCLHAEDAAVIEAGRQRTMGGTLYTTSYPCQLCAKVIIQAGIKKVFYNKDYDSQLSKQMFRETDIQI